MGQMYRGAGRKLLCIDDNQAILEYVKSLFERWEFEVVITASPQQGLRLAETSRFHVVLVDYHMPEMSGHQVALELRRIKPEIPIVLLSGSEIPEETHKLVDAVVPKTVAITELLPTVTRLCSPPSPP